MIDFDKPYPKRLPGFESFDKITFQVIPRFKSSGLSGDGWRTSVRADFYFKGLIVHEAWFHDMRTALLMSGAEWVKAQEPIPEEVLKIERERCDQPGCDDHGTRRVQLKREYSDRGDLLDKSEASGLGPRFRKFCEKHADRGSCSREDCEANYKELK